MSEIQQQLVDAWPGKWKNVSWGKEPEWRRYLSDRGFSAYANPRGGRWEGYITHDGISIEASEVVRDTAHEVACALRERAEILTEALDRMEALDD